MRYFIQLPAESNATILKYIKDINVKDVSIKLNISGWNGPLSFNISKNFSCRFKTKRQSEMLIT